MILWHILQFFKAQISPSNYLLRRWTFEVFFQDILRKSQELVVFSRASSSLGICHCRVKLLALRIFCISYIISSNASLYPCHCHPTLQFVRFDQIVESPNMHIEIETRKKL